MQIAGCTLNPLLAWARGNPLWSRLWLRLGLRMLLAMTIVPALQLVAWRIDQSANVAAVLGVVLALWLGTVLADRVCVFLVIPKVQGK